MYCLLFPCECMHHDYQIPGSALTALLMACAHSMQARWVLHHKYAGAAVKLCIHGLLSCLVLWLQAFCHAASRRAWCSLYSMQISKLSKMLFCNPQVLLLDEPLAGLDWRSRAEVAQTLQHLKSRCTLLVVSHDLHDLEPLVSLTRRCKQEPC